MSIAYQKMISSELVYKRTKNKKEIEEYETRVKRIRSPVITKDYKQYSTKYIVCGDIIEKYTYEKSIERGIVKDENDNCVGRRSVADSDSRDINRGKVLTRARNKVRRMINCNPDLKTFVTLTFEDNVIDLKYSNKEFKKFIQRLQYNLKNEFKYVAVIEFQQRGAIHYHMLCNYPIEFKVANWIVNSHGKRYRRKTSSQKEFELSFQSRFWKNGFVDIQPLTPDSRFGDEVDNVGAYVTKYMTVDLDDDRLKGNKMYLMSKNLSDSVEVFLSDKEIDVLENVYNLSNCESVYNNSYTNDYIGKVEYKQYNLKRLKKVK